MGSVPVGLETVAQTPRQALFAPGFLIYSFLSLQPRSVSPCAHFSHSLNSAFDVNQAVYTVLRPRSQPAVPVA